MGTQKNHLNKTVLLSTRNKGYVTNKKIFTILRSFFLLLFIWIFVYSYVSIMLMKISVGPDQLASGEAS